MKGSLRLRPLRATKNNKQKRKKEKSKSKAASPKKPHLNEENQNHSRESSSHSDEEPVGKLKKLEVCVNEDSDAHFPAPPPKRKAAGMASGSTTKGAHSPPHERTRTHILSTSLPPSQFQFRWHKMCVDAWFASHSEDYCDP